MNNKKAYCRKKRIRKIMIRIGTQAL
ncbi:hypothetical protein ES1_01340 [[Eubacterium] siraeum V10Sc8a]|uniref:Uncharacterized protein n=1 Tax=[Eubacterium] siraeum V10Sc8a TaxID=717961 RepID=D4MHV5_9FIRM|nr:hypothetical protein ES1_01340 [[Eubacterium] siraeum V10Sc8a]